MVELPSVITIHGRIQKQMYSGEASWEEIAKAVKLRNELDSDTLIHGNGDVFDMQTGLDKIKKYRVDGVMIGRGIISNPWFFSKMGEVISPEKKLELLWKHAELFDRTWTREKSFAIMKRFFKSYTSGFHGAAFIRGELMKAKDIDDVKKVLQDCEYYLAI